MSLYMGMSFSYNHVVPKGSLFLCLFVPEIPTGYNKKRKHYPFSLPLAPSFVKGKKRKFRFWGRLKQQQCFIQNMDTFLYNLHFIARLLLINAVWLSRTYTQKNLQEKDSSWNESLFSWATWGCVTLHVLKGKEIRVYKYKTFSVM